MLDNLMRMGVKDWLLLNQMQGVQLEVMIHATAMTARVIQQLYLLEDQVGPVRWLLRIATDRLFHRRIVLR